MSLNKTAAQDPQKSFITQQDNDPKHKKTCSQELVSKFITQKIYVPLFLLTYNVVFYITRCKYQETGNELLFDIFPVNMSWKHKQIVGITVPILLQGTVLCSFVSENWVETKSTIKHCFSI